MNLLQGMDLGAFKSALLAFRFGNLRRVGCGAALVVSFQFGITDVLLVVDAEEEVVAEFVAAVDAVAEPCEIDFGALWQPESCVRFAESDRAVFDVGVIGHEFNLGDRCDDVGFQAEDVVIFGGDPRSAFEFHLVVRAVHSELVGLDAIGFVGQLPKMNLPSQTAAGAGQSFADHVVVGGVVRMKNKNERRQTICGDAIGKLRLGAAAVSIFADAKRSSE